MTAQGCSVADFMHYNVHTTERNHPMVHPQPFDQHGSAASIVNGRYARYGSK